MDEENNEDVISSENGEDEDFASENEESESEEPDLEALQKEKEELSDKNKKLFERAKKAEAEAKKLREQLKPEGEKPEGENLEKSQSNEPDYAKIAFLEQRNVKHPDDQKLVQDEAERLKLPLTDVLNMEHIKTKLKDMQDDREAKGGMPKGGGKPGTITPQDVDYWLAKGETPDDQELAEKVIEARMKKEGNQNKFSDELYTE